MAIVTRAVAASAYRITDDRACLTHAVDEDTLRPLCRKVKPASILDDTEATDGDELPTCPACLVKDPRRVA